MEMNRPVIIFVSLMSVLLLAGVSVSTIKAENIDLFDQQKLISHLLVNAFLEKVDEGNLTVFDHAIKRGDLISHHVAYIHHLGDDELKAQLCFKLTRNILVPDFEGFYVERIIVEMAKDGSIVEISTHVSPVVEQEAEQEQRLNKDHVDQ